MGLFRRKTVKPEVPPAPPPEARPIVVAADTAALDQLRAELASLTDRLDAADRANAELEATVHTLNQRLIVTAPPPAPAPAEPVESTPAEYVSVDQHAATDATVERLQERLTSAEQRIDQRIDQLDIRITSISTELANQLTEIGNDIEPMHDSAERLAAEQARYQIQFREDLAELAERIRRPGTA